VLYLNFDSAENWSAIFPTEVERYLFLCPFFGRQQRAAIVSDDFTLNCEHASCALWCVIPVVLINNKSYYVINIQSNTTIFQ